MIFKSYQLTISDKRVYITESEEVEPILAIQLEKIEEEIIKEYLAAQEGKIGITTLGNRLQYNKNFKNLFGTINENITLVQATENKRAFLKLLFETLKSYDSNIVYFFILNKKFGKESNLVDGTFINLDDIDKYLNLVIQSAQFNKKIDLKIVEMKSFSNYYIQKDENNYSKIIKLNNG